MGPEEKGPPLLTAVLDTNVWVSVFLSGRLSASLLPAIASRGNVRLVSSEGCLDEFLRVLDYPRIKDRLAGSGIRKEQAAELVRLSCVLVSPKRRVRLMDEDPSDNLFLEAAEESGADYLVTGDSHLLRLGRHKGTRILRPSEFTGILRGAVGSRPEGTSDLSRQ